jgi:hypothetical protein
MAWVALLIWSASFIHAVAGWWFCTSVRGKIDFSCPIFFTSNVERTGQAVRGDGCFAVGYEGFPVALVMEGRLLAMEREEQGHPLPHPLFSLSPTPLETLAAAMALHIGVTATARAAGRQVGMWRPPLSESTRKVLMPRWRPTNGSCGWRR